MVMTIVTLRKKLNSVSSVYPIYQDKNGDGRLLDENAIKQELSFAYVSAIASNGGFSCERTTNDRDSVDLRIIASGRLREDSIVRSPSIDLQVKATSQIQYPLTSDTFSFRIQLKNYNELRGNNFQKPRYLVVLILPQERMDWITQDIESLILRRCAFWKDLRNEPETENVDNVSIHIPAQNIFTTDTLRDLLIRASNLEGLN